MLLFNNNNNNNNNNCYNNNNCNNNNNNNNNNNDNKTSGSRSITSYNNGTSFNVRYRPKLKCIINSGKQIKMHASKKH